MNTDILFFFNDHADALPLYLRLEAQILTQIPDAVIKVSKTQIRFSNQYNFAVVSFTPCRKAKDRPKVWLTVSFGLSYRKDSTRIDAATQPYPNRWTHHVMIGSEAELDDELIGWLREAAAFSAAKRGTVHTETKVHP